MAVSKESTKTDPADLDVGGDADVAGIAQTITTEDIQATLISEDSVDQRLDALHGMRRELEARNNGDLGGNIEPLIHDVDHAIAQLQKDHPTADAESSLKTY